MSGNRAILIVLPLLAAVAAFWFLALSPKRDEAAELKDDRERLEASVSQLEQQVAAAERTRDDFPRAYKRLVVLGKAVPEDADTPSLFVELSSIGKTNRVQFRAIELESAGSSAPPPPPPPPEAGSDGGTGEPQESDQVPAGVEVPATEAAAAVLPIGASIGPAGLPVMPYTLQFRGKFFDVTDFMAGVDTLVSAKDGKTRIRGRLLTVDGFALNADPNKGFPSLEASFSVTTYITPLSEGVFYGATPSAPAPAGPAGEPTPTSNPSGAP